MTNLPFSNGPRRKVNVLILNTLDAFGGYLVVERALLRHIDLGRFNAYFAGNGSCNAYRQFVDAKGVPVTGYALGAAFRDSTSVLRWVKATSNVIPMTLSLARLARFVKNVKIDIVHTTEKPKDCLYGVLLARLTGCSYVLHMHYHYYPELSRLVHNGLRAATAVVAVSEYARQSLIRQAGLSPPRVHPILNATDLARFRPGLDGSYVRAEYSVPHGAPLLVVIGRLYPAKGQSDLIKAIATVREEFPDVRCLIAGRDERMATPGRASFRTMLEALSRELGVEHNVIFTGFRIDTAEVLSAADIAIVPSWEEPFGLVATEAMACARPVIATRAGGLPEIVRDGVEGVLVEPRSPGGLAAAITDLLRQPSKMRDLGQAGRIRAEALFGEDRLARDFEALYDQLVNAKRARF